MINFLPPSLSASHVRLDLCEKVVAAFSLPSKVQNAAAAYFKRFYTRHTAMDYEQTDVMLACVYLACKARGRRGGRLPRRCPALSAAGGLWA